MARPDTTDHLAPYEPLPSDLPATNRYLVRFNEGHSIEEHFGFLGAPLGDVQYQHLEYQAELSEELRDRVRKDAGVKEVVQQTADMARDSTYKNRSVITYPGSHLEVAPGYNVTFTDPTYSKWEHLRSIKPRVDTNPTPAMVSYQAEALSEEQIAAVFADPKVHSIAQRMWGRYTDYIAPYQPMSDPPAPGPKGPRVEYIVYFHEGHTIWKHFEWMGGPLLGLTHQHLMYNSIFYDEELERVRRDPGVRLVVQADRKMRREAIQSNRSVMTCPGSGFDEAPGYHVFFTDEEYTLQEHLQKTGLSLNTTVHWGLYSAELTDVEIQAVLADPKVHYVSKNMSGRFN